MSPEWSCSVPRDIVGQVSPGVPWCPLVSLVSPCVPWCLLFSPGVPWCPLAVVPQGDEELSHSTKCYTRPVFPSQIQLLIDQPLTNKRKEELTLYESKCFGHTGTMSQCQSDAWLTTCQILLSFLNALPTPLIFGCIERESNLLDEQRPLIFYPLQWKHILMTKFLSSSLYLVWFCSKQPWRYL